MTSAVLDSMADSTSSSCSSNTPAAAPDDTAISVQPQQPKQACHNQSGSCTLEKALSAAERLLLFLKQKPKVDTDGTFTTTIGDVLEKLRELQQH